MPNGSHVDGYVVVSNGLHGSSMTDMLHTSSQLAENPELAHRVEDEVRKTLDPGELFWIDNIGIGHLSGNLHVSLSVTDVSGGKL